MCVSRQRSQFNMQVDDIMVGTKSCDLSFVGFSNICKIEIILWVFLLYLNYQQTRFVTYPNIKYGNTQARLGWGTGGSHMSVYISLKFPETQRKPLLRLGNIDWYFENLM